MINITQLPDAWEMVTRLGGQDSNNKEDLYDIYYKISTAIFDYRVKHNLSQKKLAEKLGVTQPMIAKLESGNYNYTIEQLWKISSKLNFTFSIDFEERKDEEYSIFSREETQGEIADYEVGFLAVGS